MQKQLTELIVLAYTKIKEKSIVLHTLSSAFGKKSFIVNISKQTKMSLFLPLNLLEAEVIPNSKSKLWSLKNIYVQDSLLGIRDNIYKNTMTIFMAELIFRLLREDYVDKDLFDSCKFSILTLNVLQENYMNYHIRFILELAVNLGFSPNYDSIMPFVAVLNKDDMVDYKIITNKFLSSNLLESMMIKMTGYQRNMLANQLLKYLEYHTETTLNIKSLSVLRELFS